MILIEFETIAKHFLLNIHLFIQITRNAYHLECDTIKQKFKVIFCGKTYTITK